MLIVTTEVVPGYRVLEVLGYVYGVTARTHNPYEEGVKALTGGLNPQMARALGHWREEAVNEMIKSARRRGANAVIGMRFDHREISSSWAEICAYGTAVRVEAAPLASTVDATASGAATGASGAEPGG
ncbi:MAG: hypothetical protein AUI14_11895 [Actinobacteria bacterium 13_2_20CM_2_71_6]|nr:MAG: hypothetical protein AUI14_11895 [Actinobacteria bacterium 13_2_20CM_2_71_6]